jgi:hypothetical protein
VITAWATSRVGEHRRRAAAEERAQQNHSDHDPHDPSPTIAAYDSV